MEPKLSSNLEDNIGHPFAPLLYATSTLHCLTVSLRLRQFRDEVPASLRAFAALLAGQPAGASA